KSSLSSRLVRAREQLRDRFTRRGIMVSTAALAAVSTEKASATVPALLTLATVRAAMQKTAEGITANVAALTREGMQAMGATKAKAGVALVFMAVAVSTFGSRLAAIGEPVQENPKAVVTKPAAESRQPTADLHDDPLPPEALVRLGT